MCVCVALAGNAGMVRSSVSRQRQEWGDHVGVVGPGDPARNWNQQPTSPTETASCHSGDGQHHESLGSSDGQNGWNSATLSFLVYLFLVDLFATDVLVID